MALQPGTRLGPYEIVSLLGAGGMGEVYRARDPRLGRDVAVKVMAADFSNNADWLRRFEQEARATAALSHPNVLTIYDVGKSEGRSYVVTELLDGETLRQRLAQGAIAVRSAVELVQQILSGLGAAHAAGIVHRDLKPENIFITRQGRAKILDFGLAKVKSVASSASPASIATFVSEPGLVVGTASYMVPEQARGQAADARSDLFSVGAMLYEMLCGQRAFHGDSMADTLSAILKEQPASLSRRGIAAPPALVRIINRCLEKNAADRFQTARDVAFALEAISDHYAEDALQKPREKPVEKSIAVLPFTNMGGDADQEYFSDGLAEELINALAGLSGLRVASRTSAFRFRGRDLDIREIGKQLNVETVLEGSVRRAGKRLRITAQLINIADGYHLWSQRYDRELEDVFAIQDEITESIVRTLKPTLLGSGSQQQVAKRHTDNLQAYELYLKGRHYWQQRSERSLRASIDCFERAIALDSGYALAHAGIADSFSILRIYGYVSGHESRTKGETAARRALELEPGLAEAHFALAVFTLYFVEDWPMAEERFRRAIELSPQTPIFHAYLGFFLAGLHRFPESDACFAKALELDPLSPLAHSLFSFSKDVARRHGEAIRAAERAAELVPDYPLSLMCIGLANGELGHDDTAIAALERLALVSNRTTWFLGMLGLVYASAGRRKEAQALLDELRERSQHEYVSPAGRLAIEVGLGNRGGVIRELQACLDESITGFAVEITLGGHLDALVKDPAYEPLLRRLRVVMQR
jgi:serine/threonine protein kinase